MVRARSFIYRQGGFWYTRLLVKHTQQNKGVRRSSSSTSSHTHILCFSTNNNTRDNIFKSYFVTHTSRIQYALKSTLMFASDAGHALWTLTEWKLHASNIEQYRAIFIYYEPYEPTMLAFIILCKLFEIYFGIYNSKSL